MKFILGTKQEMTTIYKDARAVAVTKVSAGPCFVTQIKSKDGKDGYTAVQFGYGEKKGNNKALSGHLKENKNLRHIKEVRLNDAPSEEIKPGQKITTAVFEKGEKVQITGTSKGKGFAGVVKRHGFKGQISSHGTKDQVRMSGSIGATGPARVFKGTRMAGRMGGDQVTVPNLEIIDIDIENNILYINGALPGARNSLVFIKSEGEMDFNTSEKGDKEGKDLKSNKPKEQENNETKVKVEEPSAENNESKEAKEVEKVEKTEEAIKEDKKEEPLESSASEDLGEPSADESK